MEIGKSENVNLGGSLFGMTHIAGLQDKLTARKDFEVEK